MLLNIPIACFVTMLLIFTIGNIYANQTTLEVMKQDTSRRRPIVGVDNRSNKTEMPNRYDVLWPNNIRYIMGPYLILWPIPFYAPEMEG